MSTPGKVFREIFDYKIELMELEEKIWSEIKFTETLSNHYVEQGHELRQQTANEIVESRLKATDI